ncbi:hypothetical protein [Haliscomenobacter sp.]|uniref:hypothetical protein n=1 Tax=Haliscomenobacter sp. TaxID=2717303 RepID=UPI003593A5F5
MIKKAQSHEIARKLLKRNLSDEDIAEDTGLTIEQVRRDLGDLGGFHNRGSG